MKDSQRDDLAVKCAFSSIEDWNMDPSTQTRQLIRTISPAPKDLNPLSVCHRLDPINKN